MSIRYFIETELRGWTMFEKIWMLVCVSVILTLSLYWDGSLIGIISAVTGVLYVLFNGKGKLSSYLFGIINTLGYSFVSFKTGYYGEVMLNMLYFLPMCIIGWCMWQKNIDSASGEVIKKRLTFMGSIITYSLTAAGVILYGYILGALGGTLPYVDSMSTVISITAQILCVRRYAEQWILWTVVNAITVVMWAVSFANGGESVATLLMWIIYLLSGIIMYIKWLRESNA